jgi:NADPH:quinone reductase
VDFGRIRTVVLAIVVTRAGGPEVLEARDEPEPTPSAGQLLVDVEAVGVNFRDIYEREGNYGGPPPLVAGVEGAGTVVGSGERVAWVSAPASYAERVVVDAAKAVPVPDGISPELAAAALLQGMTAHYLVRSTYPVGPGDTAVVHAAAGGVGLLLTQLVKLAGGTVIGTTSTEEKGRARARGARRPRARPRRLRRAGSRAHRRRGRLGRLRRGGRRDLR